MTVIVFKTTTAAIIHRSLGLQNDDRDKRRCNMTTEALILMISAWTMVMGTLMYLFQKLLRKQTKEEAEVKDALQSGQEE